MSRIDDLIAEHCPNGVEFKTLGELGSMFGGLTGKSKADFQGGSARYVSYMNVFNNLSTDLEPSDFVRIAPNETQRTLQRGDVLFTGSSESMAECGMTSVVTSVPIEPLYLNSFCIGYRLFDPSVLDPEFAKYLFRSTLLRKQIVRTANGVTRFNVSKARLKKVQVPVPPIAVQREIAEILDRFAKLEAELEAKLEAELEARRAQFIHYRRHLLSSFGQTVETVSLASVCRKTSSGGTPLKSRTSFYQDGTIPWLRSQEVRFSDITDTAMRITEEGLQNSSAKWIPANCVIVAISGATAARVGVNKIPLTTNQHCCNLEIDAAKAHYRYVFHWLASHYENLKALGQGARSDLNSGIITGYPIVLPDLSTQRRVADTLDELEALTIELENRLPAEIAARRKQYEYYRDRLLTFDEAAA